MTQLRTRLPRRLAVICSAALMGCIGGTAENLPEGRVYLPSYVSPCASLSSFFPCVVTGRGIVGTLHASGSCVWLTMDNSAEVEPLWPEGFNASFGPLRIYDAKGNVIAGEGDLVTAGGTDPYEGAPSSCGQLLRVNLVEPIVKH